MHVPGSVVAEHSISRRFALAAFGSLSSVVALRLCTRRRGEMSPVDMANCVAGLFSDPAGCRRLGRHYLGTHPEEADIDTLVTLLFTSKCEGWRPDCPASLWHKIAECRASDFTAGRVVEADGWLLARTEARACALAALI